MGYRYFNEITILMDQNLTIVLVVTLLAFIAIFFSGSKKTKPSLKKHKSSIKAQPKTANNAYKNVHATAAKPPINQTLAQAEDIQSIPDVLQAFNLLTMGDICETQQQAIITMTSQYRKPHPMLLSLSKGQVSQKELVDIVKSDVKIAGRVLFVVNSPRFGVQQPIKDINHAIMYLGMAEVRSIATELALKASFESTNQQQEQSFNLIWKASALASSLSLELGKALGKDNASELSTICLLSYLGDLILLSSNPESSTLYQKGTSFLSRIATMQDKFQSNTAIIGHNAAIAWELPQPVVKDIEYSLTPLTNSLNTTKLDTEDKTDIIICYLACRIAELAVIENITTIEEMNILNQVENKHVEFFHITNMVSNYSLTQLQALLRANDFADKANLSIAKFIY